MRAGGGWEAYRTARGISNSRLPCGFERPREVWYIAPFPTKDMTGIF